MTTALNFRESKVALLASLRIRAKKSKMLRVVIRSGPEAATQAFFVQKLTANSSA
jgi:hypothetical protein